MKKTLLTLVTLVFAVFSANAQTNLIENGDFETWAEGQPVNWKSTNSASNAVLEQSTDAHAGTYSVLVQGTKSNKRLGYKELSLKAGDYVLTFFSKAATAEGGTVRPGYVLPNADGSIDGNCYKYGDYVNDLTQGTWVKVEYAFTLESAATINVVVMNGKKPGKNILVDDLSLTTTNGGIDNGGEVNPEPQPEATVYSTIADLKKNAVKDGADIVYEFKDLLVTAKAGNDVYVTDGNEATLFYGSANTLNVGDKISGKVKALLVSYWGLTELKNVVYDDVKVVSSNNVVTPLTLTLADLAAKDAFAKYESVLVTVKGIKVDATAFENFNINMVDGTSKVTLRDNEKQMTDFKFDMNKSYDIVGVVGQFKGHAQINLLNAEGIQEATATGIEGVEATEGAQVIYDLSGRRVAKAVKGLYIINGKKVYVK